MIGLLLLTACGGGATGLDLGVTMSPLIPSTAERAVVALYNAPEKCTIMRLSYPNGIIYQDEIDLRAGTPQAELFDLVPGDYQIGVFVFGSGPDLLGFGCDPNLVQIEQGKRAQRDGILVEEVRR